MNNTKIQYFESYDNNGDYYRKTIDMTQLPDNVIKGHEHETFNDTGYVTEQPYHEKTKMPYVEIISKTFTADYFESKGLKSAMHEVSNDITRYIENVSKSLKTFEDNGFKSVTKLYDVKLDSQNDTDNNEYTTTVYFIKK